LGTSAVFAAGDFFKQSAWAAYRAGHRSILLVGRLPDGQKELEGLPPGALAVPYAPHSMIMPKCSLVVHQGGAGTTACGAICTRPTGQCTPCCESGSRCLASTQTLQRHGLYAVATIVNGR
jgi:hypothetical protein